MGDGPRPVKNPAGKALAAQLFGLLGNLSAAMTPVLTDLARQYLARAEECRERASAAVTEERRQSLLQIAETWERMAKWEAQPHPQRTSGKSLKPAKSPKPHA